jgi:hypothetical protein
MDIFSEYRVSGEVGEPVQKVGMSIVSWNTPYMTNL